METRERSLETQSDAELMGALVEAEKTKAEAEPLLKARALAVLSGVPGFPWKGGRHNEKVDAKHVSFDLSGTGCMVVNVPVYWMDRQDGLALRDQFEALPGVVDVEAAGGGFVSGLHSWDVKIDPNASSTPESGTIIEAQGTTNAALKGQGI